MLLGKVFDFLPNLGGRVKTHLWVFKIMENRQTQKILLKKETTKKFNLDVINQRISIYMDICSVRPLCDCGYIWGYCGCGCVQRLNRSYFGKIPQSKEKFEKIPNYIDVKIEFLICLVFWGIGHS